MVGPPQYISNLFVYVREEEGDEGAADHNGVQDVPEVPAVAPGVQYHPQVQDLGKTGN